MEHSEFFLKKQLNSLRKNQSDRQVEVSLTPVENIALLKAQTGMMIVANTVYSVDNQLNKIPITRLPVDVENYRKIKLAIDVSDYTSEAFPEKITLYSSNPTYENIDFVYQLLQHINVTLNGIPLIVNQRIAEVEGLESEGFESIFEEQ